MTNREKLPCPFVYSNGRKCCGYISHARLYGGRVVHRAAKVRLWCSEKDDHAGAVSSWAGKDRMEFYPDKLPAAVWAALESGELEHDSR